MCYDQLRSRYAHDLEALLDEGKIDEEQAQEMMDDWESGYGDYMYDLMRDRQLFGDE